MGSLAPTLGSGAGADPKISGSGSGSWLGVGAAQSRSQEPAPEPWQSLVVTKHNFGTIRATCDGVNVDDKNEWFELNQQGKKCQCVGNYCNDPDTPS
uniref:Uncharacterized protein n=1 Tax=Bursaphelenchus xylophilus TaxID=6326 RepID=A0A1I7SUU6_BURXY